MKGNRKISKSCLTKFQKYGTISKILKGVHENVQITSSSPLYLKAIGTVNFVWVKLQVQPLFVVPVMMRNVLDTSFTVAGVNTCSGIFIQKGRIKNET